MCPSAPATSGTAHPWPARLRAAVPVDDTDELAGWTDPGRHMTPVTDAYPRVAHATDTARTAGAAAVADLAAGAAAGPRGVSPAVDAARGGDPPGRGRRARRGGRRRRRRGPLWAKFVIGLGVLVILASGGADRRASARWCTRWTRRTTEDRPHHARAGPR